MDKSINKRLSSLGVSDKELSEEKRVETHVDKMSPVEMLQALKERYKDRKDELTDINIVSEFITRIETVDQCINLISNNKERNEMLSAIKYLFSFVRDWEREIPRGLTPMGYITLSYKGDMEIKNKIDNIKERWKKDIDELD